MLNLYGYPLMHKLQKIISGGQTGADIGGLVGAQNAGIPTGGTAPKDFRTENGEQPELLKSFGLVAHERAHYRYRTKQNVADADATLIIATSPESAGTQLTIRYCKALDKPYLLIDPDVDNVLQVRQFLEQEKLSVLNVAGNRESRSEGIYAKTVELFDAVFSQDND